MLMNAGWRPSLFGKEGLANPETTHCSFCFGCPLGNRLAFLQSRHRHTGRAASLIFRERGACCVVWLPRQSFQHVSRQVSEAKREIFRSAFGRRGKGRQAGSQVNSPGRQLRMAGRRYFCDERAESCSAAGKSLQREGQADGLCEFSLFLARQALFRTFSVGLEPKFSKVWRSFDATRRPMCADPFLPSLFPQLTCFFFFERPRDLPGQTGLPRSFSPMPGVLSTSHSSGKTLQHPGPRHFSSLVWWLQGLIAPS
jgi:hypothetical protein